jgi:hypothetical protein
MPIMTLGVLPILAFAAMALGRHFRRTASCGMRRFERQVNSCGRVRTRDAIWPGDISSAVASGRSFGSSAATCVADILQDGYAAVLCSTLLHAAIESIDTAMAAGIHGGRSGVTVQHFRQGRAADTSEGVLQDTQQ